MNVTPAEIQKARDFLQGRAEPRVGRKKPSQISPRDFAYSAKEMGKSFEETLNTLAYLASGGQGEGPSPIATKDTDKLDPINALGDTPPSQKIGEVEELE